MSQVAVSQVAVAFTTTNSDYLGAWGRYVRDFGGDDVVKVDVIAERSTAFDFGWQVLVVEAISSMLTRSFVEDVHGRGRGVLAVWDSPGGRQRALDLGVDELIEVVADGSEFVAKVVAMGPEFPSATTGRVRARARRPVAGASAPKRRGGQMVAVGGPPGALPEPVVVGLAKATSERGESTAILDTNDVCPAMAQLLGLRPVPNLASAIARARAGTDPADDLQVAGRFHVLAGLADASQWSEVSARSVLPMVVGLAARFDRSFVTVGPLVESAGHHGDRFATTRAVLAEADVIVGVGTADPLGLARLTTWVAGTRAVAPRTPLFLAVTGEPGDRFRQEEISEELDVLGSPADSFRLPDIDRHVRRGQWNGEVPGGRFMREVAKVAGIVAPKVPKR